MVSHTDHVPLEAMNIELSRQESGSLLTSRVTNGFSFLHVNVIMSSNNLQGPLSLKGRGGGTPSVVAKAPFWPQVDPPLPEGI